MRKVYQKPEAGRPVQVSRFAASHVRAGRIVARPWVAFGDVRDGRRQAGAYRYIILHDRQGWATPDDVIAYGFIGEMT